MGCLVHVVANTPPTPTTAHRSTELILRRPGSAHQVARRDCTHVPITLATHAIAWQAGHIRPWRPQGMDYIPVGLLLYNLTTLRCDHRKCIG